MNFDINIFLVTAYGRMHLENMQVLSKGVAFLNNIEFHLEHSKHPVDLRLLRAAKDYYLHLYNVEHEKLMHKAMVKDLQSYKNIILISAFCNEDCLCDTDGFMYEIAAIDLNYYNIKQPALEKRVCHMNENNNLIFANKLKEYLIGDMSKPFTIDLNDYVEPIGEPYEKYFCD